MEIITYIKQNQQGKRTVDNDTLDLCIRMILDEIEVIEDNAIEFMHRDILYNILDKLLSLRQP